MKMRQALLGLLVTATALSLCSCGEHEQEMEEKVSQLQRELDEANRQLAVANQALTNRTPAETPRASATPSASLPSRETLEASYNTSAAEFRKKLETNLRDYHVDSCTLHTVQIPAEVAPFTSQISFAFSSTDGRSFSTDIPVKADVSGKWIFPSVEEVSQRVTNADRMASATAPPTTNPRAASPGSGKGNQPASYMQVDGTVVIQWPDSNPAPAPNRASSPPAPPVPPSAPSATIAAVRVPTPPPRPQPSAPPNAPAVMPVDRDVHIQFPSPP